MGAPRSTARPEPATTAAAGRGQPRRSHAATASSRHRRTSSMWPPSYQASRPGTVGGEGWSFGAPAGARWFGNGQRPPRLQPRKPGGAKETRWPARLHTCPEGRSEEHTSELQSQSNLVCRLLLEKKKKSHYNNLHTQ